MYLPTLILLFTYLVLFTYHLNSKFIIYIFYIHVLLTSILHRYLFDRLLLILSIFFLRIICSMVGIVMQSFCQIRQ